ncbi:MAG: PilN domain-containing protein [Halothiobacillaceae bacterium]
MARINLLPWRDAQRERRQKEFIQQLVGVVLLAGLVVFGLHSYVGAQIDQQENRNEYLRDVIKDLDRDIQSIQNLDEERDRLLARMEVIQELQSQRPLLVHVMNELVATLPDGIQIESIRIQNDKQISIQGVADAQARVADYLRQLNRARHLGNASIVGSGILAQEPGDAMPGGRYAFSIRAAITPLKPESGDKES